MTFEALAVYHINKVRVAAVRVPRLPRSFRSFFTFFLTLNPQNRQSSTVCMVRKLEYNSQNFTFSTTFKISSLFEFKRLVQLLGSYDRLKIDSFGIKKFFRLLTVFGV